MNAVFFFAPADYEFAKIQSTNSTSIAFLSAGPIVFRPAAAATLLQSVRVGH